MADLLEVPELEALDLLESLELELDFDFLLELFKLELEFVLELLELLELDLELVLPEVLSERDFSQRHSQ